MSTLVNNNSNERQQKTETVKQKQCADVYAMRPTKRNFDMSIHGSVANSLARSQFDEITLFVRSKLSHSFTLHDRLIMLNEWVFHFEESALEL